MIRRLIAAVQAFFFCIFFFILNSDQWFGPGGQVHRGTSLPLMSLPSLDCFSEEQFALLPPLGTAES